MEPRNRGRRRSQPAIGFHSAKALHPSKVLRTRASVLSKEQSLQAGLSPSQHDQLEKQLRRRTIQAVELESPKVHLAEEQTTNYRKLYDQEVAVNQELGNRVKFWKRRFEKEMGLRKRLEDDLALRTLEVVKLRAVQEDFQKKNAKRRSPGRNQKDLEVEIPEEVVFQAQERAEAEQEPEKVSRAHPRLEADAPSKVRLFEYFFEARLQPRVEEKIMPKGEVLFAFEPKEMPLPANVVDFCFDNTCNEKNIPVSDVSKFLKLPNKMKPFVFLLSNHGGTNAWSAPEYFTPTPRGLNEGFSDGRFETLSEFQVSSKKQQYCSLDESLYGVCISVNKVVKVCSPQNNSLEKEKDFTKKKVEYQAVTEPPPVVSEQILERFMLVPHALCMVSRFPFFSLFFQVLEKLARSREMEIHNTKDELVLFLQDLYAREVPRRGKALHMPRLQLQWSRDQVVARPDQLCSRFEERWGYLSTWCIPQLMDSLPLDQLLMLVGCLLLEVKVVVVSSSLQDVSSAVLGLVALTRPLLWVNPVIPFLPAKMAQIVEAPVPLIAGVQDFPRHLISPTPNGSPAAFRQETAVVCLETGQVILSPALASNYHAVKLPGLDKLYHDLAAHHATIQAELDAVRPSVQIEEPLATSPVLKQHVFHVIDKTRAHIKLLVEATYFFRNQVESLAHQVAAHFEASSVDFLQSSEDLALEVATSQLLHMAPQLGHSASTSWVFLDRMKRTQMFVQWSETFGPDFKQETKKLRRNSFPDDHFAYFDDEDDSNAESDDESLFTEYSSSRSRSGSMKTQTRRHSMHLSQPSRAERYNTRKDRRQRSATTSIRMIDEGEEAIPEEDNLFDPLL